tara:strand:+ start:5960 stop:6208 length:249 start_codon:yes stop_codon:yes gene_type:complete
MDADNSATTKDTVRMYRDNTLVIEFQTVAREPFVPRNARHPFAKPMVDNDFIIGLYLYDKRHGQTKRKRHECYRDGKKHTNH